MTQQLDSEVLPPFRSKRSRRLEKRQAKRAKKPKRPLTKRVVAGRIIFIALLLAFAATVFYLIFFTEVLAPLWAKAPAVQAAIDWVTDDPYRLIGSGAIFFLTHIGMYEFLTGRRF